MCYERHREWIDITAAWLAACGAVPERPHEGGITWITGRDAALARWTAALEARAGCSAS